MNSHVSTRIPFDTNNPLPSSSSSNAANNSTNAWASSYASGYSGGEKLSQSWRENVLSEALRKVLEECDIVKGFNLMIDGGTYSGGRKGLDEDTSSPSFIGANKHAKQLKQIVAGGAFLGGLAKSFLEELQEECRSAGRLSILVDPIFIANNSSNMPSHNEANRVDTFRRCVNAGLALHGLSSNSDAFLPVSIDGAHRHSTIASRQVIVNNHPNNQNNGRRRLGIQSGFLSGVYSGNSRYDDDANDPFATASSLTYHEFLSCAKPSSDRRRSILEMMLSSDRFLDLHLGESGLVVAQTLHRCLQGM
ncbi:hypothetical protein ACHAWT_001317 [Skeletonema menzelii]